MRAALIQLNVGDDPAANLPVTLDFVRQAAAGGATLLLTPEATNILTPDRDRQATSGALAEPGPIELEQLHASLRHLHTLHAPHVAARQAFEAALADAIGSADEDDAKPAH